MMRQSPPAYGAGYSCMCLGRRRTFYLNTFYQAAREQLKRAGTKPLPTLTLNPGG